MAKFRYQHIKSSVEGKAPTAAQIKTAEIGVNDFAGDEKLFIKNSEGEVVDFPRGYSRVYIDENERVTAEALNDLNSRKLDASAYTPTDLSNYYTKDETSGASEIQDALDDKADTATTLGGYGITDAYTKDETSGKTEIQDALDDKADTATTYTKTEVDARDLWVSGTGTNSVAQKGGNNTASGSYSHAEGYSTSATSDFSHTEGYSTLASENSSHAEGSNTIASGHTSHAEGSNTKANGMYSHAEGAGTVTSGESSHAEGQDTEANGDYSHAEGDSTIASGESSHAEGSETLASGDYSHAEGYETKASGVYSHAEGNETIASGRSSHAEGSNTKAFGQLSHAEGSSNIASEFASHAEGTSTRASGDSSHAEGASTIAGGNSSHAEGGNTQALGSQSHAEGYFTSAMTLYSHAEGNHTVANNRAEHASGQYNVSSSASTTFGDSGNTLFSVGNGADANSRHNAFEIRQNGDIYFTSGNTDVKLQDSIPAVDSYADSVKYNDTTHYVEFYHGTTAGTKVFEYDASPFLIDGMVEDVDIEDVEISGETVTCLVISFNTAAGKQDINIPLSDIFDPDVYYTKDEIDDMEYVISQSLNDLNARKLDASAYTPTDLSNYYTKSETSGATEIQNALNEKSDTGHTHDDRYYTEIEIDDLLAGKVSTSDIDQVIDSTTSASTGAVSTSAVYGFVTSYTPSITVDQVLDDTTSASTNPVSSKAVYDVIVDNEYVWANAYATMSGAISSHTVDTDIHVTSADKAAWNDAVADSHTHSNKNELDSITGNVGTMAYENTSSYSSATEVNAALADKADTATTYTKTEVDERDLWVSGTGENSAALKGGNNVASGDYSVAIGSATTASSDYSYAEGCETLSNGLYSHVEGHVASATSMNAHAEGSYTLASGSASHAEGEFTRALGMLSHAEGGSTSATSQSSHAEGWATYVSGYSSHAEGHSTKALGYSSHAEGYYTVTKHNFTHAEGYYTSATSEASHAEGYTTIAIGEASHAEGAYTVTNNYAEHASGQYNVSSSGSSTFGDSGNTLFSVGNGTADNARHNAFEIRQNGDIYITSGNSNIKLQEYIGSVETVTAITPSNSGSTEPIATKVIAENELVMANALNDLESRKLDASAYTSTNTVTSGSTDVITSGGVYAQMDGLKLKKITQSAYDALVQAGTVDNNTLYVITD